MFYMQNEPYNDYKGRGAKIFLRKIESFQKVSFKPNVKHYSDTIVLEFFYFSANIMILF